MWESPDIDLLHIFPPLPTIESVMGHEVRSRIQEWLAPTNAEWALLRYLHPTNPHEQIDYTQEERAFWPAAIRALDRALTDPSLTFVTRTVEPRESGPQKRILRDAAVAVLGQYRHSAVVAPLYGTVPLLAEISGHLGPFAQGKSERVIPTRISRTYGDTLLPPTLVEPLPMELLDRAYLGKKDYPEPRMVVDDILDGGGVATCAVGEIIHMPLSGDTKDLIVKMREHNVLLGVLYAKDPTFMHALQMAALDDDGVWGQAQRKLVERAVLRPGEWLMGDGLDTGLPGGDIATHEAFLAIGDDHATYYPFLLHLSQSTLRVGSTIDGATRLEDGRLPDLIDFSARFLREQLDQAIGQKMGE